MDSNHRPLPCQFVDREETEWQGVTPNDTDGQYSCGFRRRSHLPSDTEWHRTMWHDTGRDHLVTTQTTTQVPLNCPVRGLFPRSVASRVSTRSKKFENNLAAECTPGSRGLREGILDGGSGQAGGSSELVLLTFCCVPREFNHLARTPNSDSDQCAVIRHLLWRWFVRQNALECENL